MIPACDGRMQDFEWATPGFPAMRWDPFFCVRIVGGAVDWMRMGEGICSSPQYRLVQLSTTLSRNCSCHRQWIIKAVGKLDGRRDESFDSNATND